MLHVIDSDGHANATMRFAAVMLVKRPPKKDVFFLIHHHARLKGFRKVVPARRQQAAFWVFLLRGFRSVCQGGNGESRKTALQAVRKRTRNEEQRGSTGRGRQAIQ